MVWLVWSGIAVFVAVLLGVSFWYDRDARRRGASPLSSDSMVEATRTNRWQTVRHSSQLLQGGATPRSQDAHSQTWKKP